MNTRIKISIYLVLLLFSQVITATTITAISSNGNWANSSTWDLNRIPDGHDRVVIPAGKKVLVNSNLYNAVPSRPTLSIDVYGILQLEGGSGQLNLKCGSVINVYGDGIIPNSGCNCNQIAIGLGEAVWKGEFSPSVLAGGSVTGGCVLPLDLLSFEAVNNSGVLFLHWSTASEINVSHFEVEESIDGTVFETATKINAGQVYYSFQVENQAKRFFRLKIIDFDNKVQYSHIIEIDKIEKHHLNIYPNPSVNGGFKVALMTDKSTKLKVVMSDLLGNAIAVDIANIDEHTALVSYPLNIATGMYFISVLQNSKQYSQTLFVQ